MKTRSIRMGAALTSVLLASGVAQAVMTEFKIDPTHSFVIFKVKNRGISYVYGRFNKVSGTIGVDDPDRTTQMEVSAEVGARSLDTNDRNRDKHVEGPDFLDAAKFKTISFKTTAESKPLEDNKFELTGELTLLGVTKELTITFEFLGIKKMEKGATRLGGETTFTIKRSEFGMDKMLEGVADEVTIIVSLQAERQPPAAG